MKNLFKLFGVIALVTVIGFSMNGCGSGDYDSATGTVKVTNNTDSTIYVGVWRAGARNDDVAMTSCPVSSRWEDYLVSASLKDGSDYFLGKYTPIEGQGQYMLTASHITQKSSAFRAEAGKTVRFTYNGGFNKK